MISTIIGNVRGINTQGVLERLKMLRKLHHLSVIAILEPFSDSVHIQSFKVQLSMENAISNCNGKIWVFWSSDIECNILDEVEQQITCNMKHKEYHINLLIPLSMLNAKIISESRRHLIGRWLMILGWKRCLKPP